MPPERSRHHVERAAAGEVCGSPGRVCGPRVRRWACGVGRVAQGRSHARTATHGAICFACGDRSGRRWCSLASGRGAGQASDREGGTPRGSQDCSTDRGVPAQDPGKTRVYPRKSRFTRKIPGRASTCRSTPYSQGPCANCGAHRLLKYAHRTMCARYKCQNAKGSIGARHGLQAAVRTTRSCHILLQDRGGAPHALVRPRSTDRKEAAQQADCCRHTICYLTRGEFGEDEHDSRVSPTHAG